VTERELLSQNFQKTVSSPKFCAIVFGFMPDMIKIIF